MPVKYENQETLHVDEFNDFNQWHHEGVGQIEASPDGPGMRLHCHGSKQGAEGCMAFFRPNLPDQISVEYDMTIHSQGGLVINYLGIRGLNGEDLIEDRDKLRPRTGIMPNYWSEKFGLQSYHVSVSRFDDDGNHSETSNWRRNPGCLLVGHGVDPCQNIGEKYSLRVTKDKGHLQVHVNGKFAHACLDRSENKYSIPDHGKFGFRLIGSDVRIDVENFRVYRIESAKIWDPYVFEG